MEERAHTDYFVAKRAICCQSAVSDLPMMLEIAVISRNLRPALVPVVVLISR